MEFTLSYYTSNLVSMEMIGPLFSLLHPSTPPLALGTIPGFLF